MRSHTRAPSGFQRSRRTAGSLRSTAIALDRKNIWVQPLDGRPRYQATHFPEGSDPVGYFAWSRDGKRLVTSKGRFFDDLVLIQGLR